MPATRTAPTTADRSTRWIIAPFDSATGGRMGMFMIRVGRRRDFYRATWLEQDDMATVVEVAKEKSDGTFAEPYRVVLAAPGGYGEPVCSCPANKWNGRCRHGDALRALLSRAL